MTIMPYNGPRVIADPEIFTRECSIAEMLADSPQLVELLVDADHSKRSGHTARAATMLADLQSPTQHRDVLAAVVWLAGATDIGAAMETLLADPRTTRPVRQLIDQLLTAAEQRAARWSR